MSLSSISSSFLSYPTYPHFKRSTKLSCYHLFLSVIWGLSGGGMVGQALSPHVNWATHFTLPFPLVSLLTSSSFSESCTLEAKIKECAQCVFSLQGVASVSSFLGGFATSMILNNYLTTLQVQSTHLGLILFLAQGVLTGIHFLSVTADKEQLKTDLEEGVYVV